MSNVLDKARADWKKLSQLAFDLDLTFENPKGETATVKGLGTRHSISVGTDGLPIRSPNNHISFHEDLIPTANPNYKIRFADKINMTDHKVSFLDVAGNLRRHVIKEVWPDQTVGMVVCMLEDEEDEFETRETDC